MYIKLTELRGRRADRKLPSTLADVAAGTGIDLRTLESMSAQALKMYRREYIDAICAYFECTPDEAIGIDEVSLPLDLVLRPDRRGRKVGERSDDGKG